MCNVSMCLCLHQHPAQKPVAPRSAWRSNNNLKCIFCIQIREAFIKNQLEKLEAAKAA